MPKMAWNGLKAQAECSLLVASAQLLWGLLSTALYFDTLWHMP